MAKYEIMHACGHTERHDIVGKMSFREWKISTLESQVCSECYKKQCEEADAQEIAERGFAPLTGTEKQIAWAEKIRLSAARTLEDLEVKAQSHMTDEEYEKILDSIPTLTDSSWWINHHGEFPTVLVKSLANHRRIAELQNTPEAKQAKEERILKPADCRFTTVVNIFDKDSMIITKSDYNPDLVKVLKEHDFSWDPDKRVWTHSAGTAFRSVDDAIADFANMLMNEGFPTCFKPELHNAAINGTFVPMPTRWINITKNKRIFIMFPDDDDAARLAGCISGAKPGRHGGYYVPLSSYDEIKDFAEQTGFTVSNGAMTAMDEYAKKIDVVEVAKAKVEAESGTDALKEILSSSRDVLDDLRDE